MPGSEGLLEEIVFRSSPVPRMPRDRTPPTARPLAWCESDVAVIGMLHAPPLPGAARARHTATDCRQAVLADARALVEGGVDALLLENFGDAPFHPGRVPVETVAHLTALAAAVRAEFDLPLGINVLRNDGCAALAIAHAVGAQFIRVNVLTSARLTDQGIVQGIAHRLLRLRRRLDADQVQIFADVDVKHSAPLVPRPLEDEVHELVERGGADGLIVTGSRTGAAVDLQTLAVVRAAAPRCPVLVGSGVTAENAAQLASLADGLIVGTALKAKGQVAGPVRPRRVRHLLEALGRGSKKQGQRRR